MKNPVVSPSAPKVRACPVCGGLSRLTLTEARGWPIVQCSGCRMVFIGNELDYQHQISDHDWMDDFSQEKSRRRQRHPFLMFCSHLSRPFRRKDNHRLLSQTLRWTNSGKLLDFGCAGASFLAHASSRFDVTGIEISPQLASLARTTIPPDRVLEGPVTHVASELVPPNSFDVVTQFGFIEHEWHPLEALRAAFRVLKPGGISILKTPNYACWNRRVMGMSWCGYHIPAHCNYFTPATLSRILGDAGFLPLPPPLRDRFPTSDSLWMAARKPDGDSS